MLRVWPTCRRLGFSPGLAAIKVSNLIPYFRAMRVGVSPALTVWERDEVGWPGVGRGKAVEFDCVTEEPGLTRAS